MSKTALKVSSSGAVMRTKKMMEYEKNPDEMQLLNDIKRLEIEEEEGKKMKLLLQNKLIFVVNSFLLGISYSIVWPTLWKYYKTEFEMTENVAKFFFCMTYIAYPIASMLSTSVLSKGSFTARQTILILTTLEIVGGMFYTVHYVAVMPLLGRAVAGFGDAFYVVLMKRTKFSSSENYFEKLSTLCLFAYVLGIIVSPGINILTTFIHFKIGNFHLNECNFPGLTIVVLFFPMLLVNLLFIEDFDLSPTSKQSKKNESRFPFIYNFNVLVNDDIPGFILVATYSFLYNFVVTSFELLIPILAYDYLKSNALDVMLLYTILGTIYGTLLLILLKSSLNHHWVSLTVCSVAKVVGISGVYFLVNLNKTYAVVSFTGLCLALPILWAYGDIVFANLLQQFVSIKVRDDAHQIRKLISKIAFLAAGVTVPFYLPNIFAIMAPILISLVLLVFSANITFALWKNFSR